MSGKDTGLGIFFKAVRLVFIALLCLILFYYLRSKIFDPKDNSTGMPSRHGSRVVGSSNAVKKPVHREQKRAECKWEGFHHDADDLTGESASDGYILESKKLDINDAWTVTVRTDIKLITISCKYRNFDFKAPKAKPMYGVCRDGNKRARQECVAKIGVYDKKSNELLQSGSFLILTAESDPFVHNTAYLEAEANREKQGSKIEFVYRALMDESKSVRIVANRRECPPFDVKLPTLPKYKRIKFDLEDTHLADVGNAEEGLKKLPDGRLVSMSPKSKYYRGPKGIGMTNTEAREQQQKLQKSIPAYAREVLKKQQDFCEDAERRGWMIGGPQYDSKGHLYLLPVAHLENVGEITAGATSDTYHYPRWMSAKDAQQIWDLFHLDMERSIRNWESKDYSNYRIWDEDGNRIED